MNGTVHMMYFSPTHTTRSIVEHIGAELAKALQKEQAVTDWTLPAERGQSCTLNAEDVLVLGVPVYSGRIPQLLNSTLAKLKGNQTPAVVVAVYGNRDYDDALLEAQDLLTANGFVCGAAGAFIGEHSLSRKLAAGRPDQQDLQKATAFARQIVEKMQTGTWDTVTVKGQKPYKALGPAMSVAPKTTEACNDCLACAKACPMGVIDRNNPRQVAQGCINCYACVKGCPQQAKYFDHEMLLMVTKRLESTCMERKEPECFV